MNTVAKHEAKGGEWWNDGSMKKMLYIYMDEKIQMKLRVAFE